jgi:peptide deformylase
MKELVVYPDERLRTFSQPVTEFGAALDELVEEMTWVLRNLCGNGVGLSAIQAGVPLRVGILELNWQSKKKGKPMVICNPKILKVEGTQDGDEGCLSFPGKFVRVQRPNLVQISYQNRLGELKKEMFTGLWARCVLHEIDHLDGVLVIDRFKEQNPEGGLITSEKTR